MKNIQNEQNKQNLNLNQGLNQGLNKKLNQKKEKLIPDNKIENIKCLYNLNIRKFNKINIKLNGKYSE